MVERKITVIVSEVETEEESLSTNSYTGSSGYEYNDYTTVNKFESSNLNQILNLDELIEQDWFIRLIKEKGFFSSKDLGNKNEYTNNFIYNYSSRWGSSYAFTNDLKDVHEDNEIVGVYQEVLGIDRLYQLKKWKKAREEYLKKKEKRKKDYAAKESERKEKARLRKIAKAKKLLEQEEGSLV